MMIIISTLKVSRSMVKVQVPIALRIDKEVSVTNGINMV